MIDRVTLEPETTLMGRFQKERTDAISEMFDNASENGIFPTTKFFVRLDSCVRELLSTALYDGILLGIQSGLRDLPFDEAKREIEDKRQKAHYENKIQH